MKHSENDTAKINEKRKNELLLIANMYSIYLATKKRKVVLKGQIRKYSRELEYIRYRLERTEKLLGEKKAVIEEIETEQFEFDAVIQNLRSEKDDLENEYDRMSAIQKAFEKKQDIVKTKKSKIDDLNDDIRNDMDKYNDLKCHFEEKSEQKGLIEKEIKINQSKLARLSTEINTISNTKDMMTGTYQGSLNIEEFLSKNDQDKTLEDYLSEVTGVIENMENEITNMNVWIDESETKERTLSLRRAELQEKIKTLKGHIDVDADRNTLNRELQKLSQKRDILIKDMHINNDELKSLTPQQLKMNDQLVSERQGEKDYNAMLKHLEELKQQYDSFESVEVEINKMNNSIIGCKIDTDTSNDFLNIINQVKEMIESMNQVFRSANNTNNEEFNDDIYFLLLNPKNYEGEDYGI